MSKGVADGLRSYDPDDYNVTDGHGDDLFFKADETVLLIDEKQAELMAEALNDHLNNDEDNLFKKVRRMWRNYLPV